jgi:hypothetical protein
MPGMLMRKWKWTELGKPSFMLGLKVDRARPAQYYRPQPSRLLRPDPPTRLCHTHSRFHHTIPRLGQASRVYDDRYRRL